MAQGFNPNDPLARQYREIPNPYLNQPLINAAPNPQMQQRFAQAEGATRGNMQTSQMEDYVRQMQQLQAGQPNQSPSQVHPMLQQIYRQLGW